MLSSFLETGYRLLLLWFTLTMNATATVPPGLGDGFWHTSGSQILDAANRPVRIAGINWYGFETVKAVPGGLDLQDYCSIVQGIRRNGYNTIRIPLSNQMVETLGVPADIKFSNRSGPINTDLKGLNSLQILDRIISCAGAHGLKVILDNHRSEAGDGPEISGLWFTQGYPEAAWVADWRMLARRYAADPTVLGMDLRNEPHNANSGGACWSCGGANDWHLAAERAGNAVLAINPKLLIFVEGVDTFENESTWWGGNLMGVRSSPVRLKVPHQLVYSAHDYGPVEAGQAWFNPSLSDAALDASLQAVWTKNWAYLSQNNIAPVWLGEFGYVTSSTGTATPTEAMEAQWFRSLVSLLTADPRLGWTYWALNGGDRYGLLNPNYDAPRSSGPQAALAPLQAPLSLSIKNSLSLKSSNNSNPRQGRGAIPHNQKQPSAPASIPKPQAVATDAPQAVVSTAPQAVVIAAPPSELRCQVTYANLKDWQRGFNAVLKIRNTGTTPIEGWKLTFVFPGNQRIEQLWPGQYTQNGHAVMLASESFNATILPSAEINSIGFNAAYSGDNSAPAQFYLNDTLCN